jgi:selenocysteine-specific elongation factor
VSAARVGPVALMPGRPHVVATAGHVDHGKSTLVRALTGTDPDRLAEEKRRGLTLDLGFAGLPIDGLGPVAIVDVPGHERFVATMLAGVAVVEAVLLCVDAREGWRAQSEEHLRIVELAGIDRGVVAVTKASTVDARRRAAATAEVHAQLAGGPLAGSAVVPCDALAHWGLDDVVAALGDVLRAAPPPPDAGRPRLWVDRSFAVAGAGTVVTGGVGYGTFDRGDRVEVVTAGGPMAARVRAIQHLGIDQASAPAGGRAALNLSGVSHREVRRGDAVVRPGEWETVGEVDVDLHVLNGTERARDESAVPASPAGAARPLRARGAHLAYVGSHEQAVRLRVLGAPAVEPGATRPVRVRLTRPLPLAVSDRVVLRDAGRGTTVAGGPVAALAPSARRRAPVPPTEREVLSRVERSRPVGLDLAAEDDAARAACRALADRGEVVIDRGYAMAPGWADELGRHPWLAAVRAAPFAPPPADPDRVHPSELRALARRGLVVGGDRTWFDPAAVTRAADRIRAVAGPEFTLAEARTALATSRRYALAVCDLLDARGVTARDGEHRRFRDSDAGQAGHGR